MNINYENLIIYHCKNKTDYGTELIKNVVSHYNIEDLLALSLFYDNHDIVKYALTLSIKPHILDKVFKKACSLNNIDIVKIYNNYNRFKYRYTIENGIIQGVITLVARAIEIEFDDVCCICCDNSMCKTKCGHELCIRCYKKVCLELGNCPLCRETIDFCYVSENSEL